MKQFSQFSFHQMIKAPAIAIDLGSTYSRVGVFQDGKFDMIAVGRNNHQTATYAAFTDNEQLVGDDAKNQIILNPSNTISDIKRLIGRKFDDPFIQSDINRWPFTVELDSYNYKIKVYHEGKIKYVFPEEILKMIFTKLKSTAETHLGKKVTNAVITVPASFNDSQRQAVKRSGVISGLNVLQIINEPTAAVIPYVLNKKSIGEKNILVFDLGGGTCDVSIVCIDNQTIKVKSTVGDTHFGGEDFNNSLVDHFANSFSIQRGNGLKSDKTAMCRLREVCERAKHELSTSTEAIIQINSLFEGIHFHSSITRSEFEQLNIELFRKIEPLVERALFDAKVDKLLIEDLILLGGSTRIPKVQEILQSFFRGIKLNNSLNVGDNVVYGAAIQAAILQGDKSPAIQNIRWKDVNSFSLSINQFNGISNVFIKRNTSLPTREMVTFTTQDCGQNLCIEVYEGEHKFVDDNQILGSFILSGLPETADNFLQIEVTFIINADGILNVSAKEKNTKKDLKTTKIGQLEECDFCDEFYKDDDHVQNHSA